MLVLLPPSEGKTVPARGRPLDLTALSTPELTAARRAVLEALVATAPCPEALLVLGVPLSLEHQLDWDASVFTAPTAPAGRVYDGVLYGALDLASLSGPDRRRAAARLRIFSAAYGVLTVNDRIAPYRVSPTALLPGIGSVQAHWRRQLAGVLDARGLVVDCRSAPYAAMWRPSGARASGWVHVAVPGASHAAKHTRGLVARALCTSTERLTSPESLAAALGRDFTVALHDPPRSGPRVLDVLPPG